MNKEFKESLNKDMQFDRETLLKEAKWSVDSFVKGAGFNGDGEFMGYKAVQAALEAGITLESV